MSLKAVQRTLRSIHCTVSLQFDWILQCDQIDRFFQSLGIYINDEFAQKGIKFDFFTKY